MTGNALMAAAGMVICLGGGIANAADQGGVTSLSDLDAGARDFSYIYPHAGAVPPDAITTVAPVRPAPNKVAQPAQADVPLDKMGAKPAGDTASARAWHWR
jgi:hypothetical protein